MAAPMRRLSSSLACLLLGSWVLLACSADAATEPEPTLETPGAFVAVATEGGYQIVRTLTSLQFDNGQDAIFFKAYAPLARDFEDAERLARDPALPVSQELAVSSRAQVTSVEWKVVWFRTLSDEEREVLR